MENSDKTEIRRVRRNVSKAGKSAKARKKKGHPVLTVILVFLAGLFAVCCGLGIYAWSVLHGMRATEAETTPTVEEKERLIQEETLEPEMEEEAVDLPEYEETEETPVITTAEKIDGIYNYLLFGCDARKNTSYVSGNTDTMIILTLDTVHNKVKLTSIMRDILVDFPGYEYKKRLNAANSYLGIDAEVELIESLFGVPIDGYAAVNFLGLVSAVNILGGVDISITDAELVELNKNLKNQARQCGITMSPEVTSSGSVHLDGQQTLAYVRIRHLANGDYNRTARQRKVLSAVFDSVRSQNVVELGKLAVSLTKYIKTDLTETEMMKVVSVLYSLRNAETEDMRIPIEGTYKNARYRGMAIIQIEFEPNAEAAQEFIYGEGETQE